MPITDPTPTHDKTPEVSPNSDPGFDIDALRTMADEEADAEWLRQPEAWHLH